MVPNKDDQFDDGLDQFDDDLPADDFGDDMPEDISEDAMDDMTDSADGEDSAEEEWDSYDESGDGDGARPRPQKKSGMFNIILIAVAVLGGVGFMVMKMGGGSAPATAPAAIAQNNIPQPPAAQAAAQPAIAPPPADASLPSMAASPPTGGGFLTSPDNMAAMEHDIAKTYGDTELTGSDDVAPVSPQEVEQAAPPMPTAVEQVAAPVAAPGTPPEATSAVTSEGAAPIRMPNAAEAMLKSAMQDKTNTAPEPLPVTAPLGVETPPTSPTLSASVTENAALVAKLEQAMSRIGELEGEVHHLKTAQPAGDVAALNANIATLEKKLSEQTAKNAKISEQLAAQKTARANEDRVEMTAAPAPKPQILGSGTVAAPRAPSGAQTATAPSSRPQAASQWVLKGAQPGQAMVSKPGEGEMRSVVVGDTLPGIGTIRSIGYENGRWSVVGTQGRITQ